MIDVFLFLFGIVALGELAQYTGVFEWLAGEIACAARGSGLALFTALYLLGAIMTMFLSNDTTAVILTPAVLAVARAARVNALPPLYACAFIANAASFTLPISNPANLVVFGGRLPPLMPWLGTFTPSSLVAVAGTYLALLVMFRAEIMRSYEMPSDRVALSQTGRLTSWLLMISSVILVWAAAEGWHVGVTAFASAIACTGWISTYDRGAVPFILRHSAWKIVLLVAALFALVSAIDHFGGLALVRSGATAAANMGFPAGAWLVGAAVTLASSAINNLPVALAGEVAFQTLDLAPWVTHAMVVAVDLGPNLAISASLATLIWAGHLRRGGIAIRWWQFMRAGAVVTLPTLALALLLLR